MHGSNLGIYAYFADVVSAGRDPYALTSGPIDPQYADYPPFLMTAFGALAQIVSGRTAVGLLCYLGDLALVIGASHLASRRSGLDRAMTLGLVLANPLYLSAELMDVQYKTWIAAGLLAIESPAVIGAMTGAFLLPALVARPKSARDALLMFGVAGVMWLPFVATAVPAIVRARLARATMPPCHDSLGKIMDHRVVVFVAVVLALGLLWRRGTLRVSGPSALAVLAASGSETVANRWVAFALPALLVADVSWRLRALALSTCALAVLGPIWLLYLPLGVAVWFAWRSPGVISS
jgi:hypothetical protein